MVEADHRRRHDRVGRAIERWVEAGLIDAETAARLAAHEAQTATGASGRLVGFAFGAGGLLLAAGIFLFVAANWDLLSPWWRFAILIAVVASLHLGAVVSRAHSDVLATTLHAAGTAALGAGIFLGGQVFNLQADWPEGLLAWAVGAGLAAWLLRDWPQVLWTAVLAPAWLVAEWSLRFPWFRSSPGELVESVLPVGLVLLGVAYLNATGGAAETAWRRALARLGSVMVLLTAIALVRTTAIGQEDQPTVTPLWLALGWTVALGVPLALAWLLRRQQGWPVLVAALFAAVVIALDPAVNWQRLAIYLVYALASAALVRWGVAERQRVRVDLGVAGFSLTVMAFYFSSLYDMLGRAAGLIGVGLLFIAGGWLAERTRRRLLSQIDGDRT